MQQLPGVSQGRQINGNKTQMNDLDIAFLEEVFFDAERIKPLLDQNPK